MSRTRKRKTALRFDTLEARVVPAIVADAGTTGQVRVFDKSKGSGLFDSNKET